MSSLEAQVDLLASLIERLDTIREISAGNLPVHLRSAITNVSSLAEELASSQVQNALAAAETEQGIRAVDLQNSRRDIRKRKNQVETTPPIKPPERKKCSYHPRALSDSSGDMNHQTLQDFVRQFNQTNQQAQLTIWTPTNSFTGQGGPLRLVVPNVFIAYIKLRSREAPRDPIKVESVTVTGVREQRTTSEFMVFRLMSQFIFRTLARDGDMNVSDLLLLLITYHNLYTAKCNQCNMIYSAQDNTPTIVRYWVETENNQWGLQCYHESCTPP